ncbi:ribonucleoside-diphosphate reductase large subunit-like protein [Trifolium pratense]|uniref:Ribonucleoside-diphosphate reductase large subunit-like protein n=1 Tax=Trifolium pratense TaxID=57577 RepID=A0A2K3MHW2_TRIPR|nr:ribonucleoside-diphosphate reductase large subunit-like protein [Trifolium pratense]
MDLLLSPTNYMVELVPVKLNNANGRIFEVVTPSNLWDWGALRELIPKTGVRNSLLVAPMPTASTSQILGNNECFEPYTSNIYNRRAEVYCHTMHLLRDLTEMGPQNPALKNKIIYDNGSVHNLSEIPVAVKLIYKDERNLTLHRPVLKLKYTHR